MLNITRLNQQGASGTGFDILNYLKTTEYYLGKDGEAKSASFWMGKGSALLGLAEGSKINIEDMEKLAKGFSPDGTALVQNAGDEGRLEQKKDRNGQPMFDEEGEAIYERKGGHMVGFDFTLSPVKDLSTAIALAQGQDREDLINAHLKAVKDAMAWAEDLAETRSGKAGMESQSVQGLVMSAHTHFASRSLDPQLHTHVLVYNVVKGEDDKWRTMESQNLYDHMRDLGAYYRSSLAKNLVDLGYGIKAERNLDIEGEETGDVEFSIQGIDPVLSDKFSKRRDEVAEHLEEFGGTSSSAALASRAAKDEPDLAVIEAHWQKELQAHARETGKPVPTIAQLKGQRSQFLDDSSDQRNLERLHKDKAIVGFGSIVGRTALERMGQVDAAEIMNEARQFIARNQMVEVNPLDRPEYRNSERPPSRYRDTRYAASWMLDLEEQLLERSLNRVEDTSVRLNPETLRQVIEETEAQKGFKLFPEQRQAAEHVCLHSGGTAVIEGYAGAGKTSVSAVWIEAYRREGWDVVGVCVGWQAAEKLATESNIKAYSATSLLNAWDAFESRRQENGGVLPPWNPKSKEDVPPLTKKSVVVLDEAGMADTATILRLQEHCDRAGAKLVLQGDGLQLQPIAAGAGFRLVGNAVGKSTLKNIIRQKTEKGLELAKAFYEHTENLRPGSRLMREERQDSQEMFQKLEDAGCVNAFLNRNDAIKTMVKHYMETTLVKNDKGTERPITAEDKLIIVGTNKDGEKVNSEVRKALRANGTLQGEDIMVTVQQRGFEQRLGFAQGDVIRFGAKDRDLGVVNNTEGTIRAIRQDDQGDVHLTVRLKSDNPEKNGREISFKTSDYNKFGHGYAMTVHKSQGQGKAAVFHLVDPRMTDFSSSMVAFTRNTHEYHLYGGDADMEAIRTKLKKERLKENILEAGVRSPEHLVKAESLLRKMRNNPDLKAKPESIEKTRQGPERPTPAKQRGKAEQRVLAR